MRRHSLKSAMAVAVVAGMAIVGGASPAQAVLVNYTTVGSFSGTGIVGSVPVYTTASGIRIGYIGVDADQVEVPPPSNASFGQFDTTGTTATTLAAIPAGVTFTLQILQSLPGFGGPITFSGPLTGALSTLTSTAFVQFQPPLELPITAGGVTTTYRIVEADRDVAGNSILGRSNINPPSTLGGLSSVDGLISTTAAPIPEPSTLLMGALAAPAVLVFLRKKGKVTV